MDPIEQKISEFIKQEFLGEEGSNLDLHTSLLETGIIDSIGMFRLIVFLEHTFNIRVESEDFMAENFETLHRIGQYVKAQMD